MYRSLFVTLSIGTPLLLAGCRTTAPGQQAQQRALVLTEAIQQDFWDARKEAYLEVSPRRSKGLPYAMMWANGMQFTVLSGATRPGNDEYRQLMRAFLGGLERYWNSRLQLYSAYFGGTDDVYYDDNQWMILAYVDAYEATQDQAYLDKARAVADGCLAGVDDVRGGGSYWHVNRKKYPTKNTCANGPLATGLLRVRSHLADEPARERYLREAERILVWTRNTLQDKRGLMLDNINTETGKITNWTFTYNTALMIEAWLELHAVTSDPAHLAEAQRLAEASAHWLKAHGPAPDERHYEDAVFFTVHLVEAICRLHAVTGDDRWLALSRQTADFYWHAWRRGTSSKLLDVAAIARMQWLLASQDNVSPMPCPPGVRYVRIESSGKKHPLVFTEVEVVCDGTNVAGTGSTYQSTTVGKAFAACAVDGANDTVSRTVTDKNSAWWELELPRPCQVQDVRIHAHADGKGAMEKATLVLLDSYRRVVWSGAPGTPIPPDSAR